MGKDAEIHQFIVPLEPPPDPPQPTPVWAFSPPTRNSIALPNFEKCYVDKKNLQLSLFNYLLYFVLLLFTLVSLKLIIFLKRTEPIS
mgnify:CR=1 FL=1